MKTTATIVAVSILALAPNLVMAKTINGQLTQSQIDAYCASSASANGGSATFHLGKGKVLSGTVDCANSARSTASAAGGKDDNGTESESANDSDSAHED
jgi:hypothetical protein